MSAVYDNLFNSHLGPDDDFEVISCPKARHIELRLVSREDRNVSYVSVLVPRALAGEKKSVMVDVPEFTVPFVEARPRVRAVAYAYRLAEMLEAMEA